MQSSEVHIILKPQNTKDEEEIHKKLIQNSELNSHGQKIGRFHLTLCLVDNVKLEHQTELKQSLQNAVDSKPIEITFERLDRYMVGQNLITNKRTFSNCSLVIYPNAMDDLILKDINKKLLLALNRFNEEKKTKYSFMSDTLPKYFMPHLTLATTKEINNRIAENACVNRCSLIRSLNEIFQTMDKTFTFVIF